MPWLSARQWTCWRPTCHKNWPMDHTSKASGKSPIPRPVSRENPLYIYMYSIYICMYIYVYIYMCVFFFGWKSDGHLKNPICLNTWNGKSKPMKMITITYSGLEEMQISWCVITWRSPRIIWAAVLDGPLQKKRPWNSQLVITVPNKKIPSSFPNKAKPENYRTWSLKLAR